MVTHVILLVCKDSAKFRFSEGNENKFSFLSVRKLTKSNEKPNLFGFFRCSHCNATLFENFFLAKKIGNKIDIAKFSGIKNLHDSRDCIATLRTFSQSNCRSYV